MPLLGTSKRPVLLRAQSFEEADQLLVICEDNGWEAIVQVDPDAPSDLRDLRRAQGQAGFAREVRRIPIPSANSLCPCGSGRKFKRCCRDASQSSVRRPQRSVA